MNNIVFPSMTKSLVGSFESYKIYARSILDLTEKTEIDLVTKLNYSNNKEESIESAKKLILSQLKTVVKIAEQHRGYGIPVEDLVQEGNIGLMKAVKSYKLGMNTRLYSYSIIWIKSEIQSYILKNWKIVKAATTNSLKKLFFNFRTIQNKLINSDIPKEKFIGYIADKLKVSEEEVREMQNYLLGSDISLELENKENDNFFSKSDTHILQLSDYSTPEKIYQKEHDEKKMSKLLKNNLNLLSEKQRQVINLKYFNEDYINNKEISKIMGISSERVRQIESESLNKLKSLMT